MVSDGIQQARMASFRRVRHRGSGGFRRRAHAQVFLEYRYGLLRDTVPCCNGSLGCPLSRYRWLKTGSVPSTEPVLSHPTIIGGREPAVCWARSRICATKRGCLAENRLRAGWGESRMRQGGSAVPSMTRRDATRISRCGQAVMSLRNLPIELHGQDVCVFPMTCGNRCYTARVSIFHMRGGPCLRVANRKRLRDKG